MLKNKRILVAPLDWGLGHATRCIPIIKELIAQHAQVILAADKLCLKLLRTEFPELEYVEFPGMKIQYPSKNSMWIHMAFQANRFLDSILEENQLLQQIIENYAIDAVISDNRYGLNTQKVPCVLITHQLFIQLPVGKILLRKIIGNYISKFNQCWIPDFDGKYNLSGKLSHKKNKPNNTHFIGPLSRFPQSKDKAITERKLMIILSGPEPSRSIFENKLLKQLEKVEYKVLLVRGILESLSSDRHNDNVEVKNLVTSKELFEEIRKSDTILCRSGYSSIMDLASIGKKAILIPTYGQTEQEYLAKKMMIENKCYSCAEKDFVLEEALRENEKYKGLQVDYNSDILSNKINEFLNYS